MECLAVRHESYAFNDNILCFQVLALLSLVYNTFWARLLIGITIFKRIVVVDFWLFLFFLILFI